MTGAPCYAPDTRCALLLDADLQAVLCRHFVWGDFQRYVQSHCSLVQQQVLPNADQHRNADRTHEHKQVRVRKAASWEHAELYAPVPASHRSPHMRGGIHSAPSQPRQVF